MHNTIGGSKHAKSMQGGFSQFLTAKVVYAGGEELREFSVRHGRGGVVPVDERQVINLACE